MTVAARPLLLLLVALVAMLGTAPAADASARGVALATKRSLQSTVPALTAVQRCQGARATPACFRRTGLQLSRVAGAGAVAIQRSLAGWEPTCLRTAALRFRVALLGYARAGRLMAGGSLTRAHAALQSSTAVATRATQILRRCG